MSTRSYHQYCGLAHAAELVGERWALLILRDLLVGPRRFTDLQRGLPRITTSVLTTRLKQLENAGIVERCTVSEPTRAVAYALTPYGLDLEEPIMALSRWGARTMGTPHPGDVVTPDSVTMALRTTFHPERSARERTWVLDLGEFALTARTGPAGITVTREPPTEADLTISTGPALRALLGGELSPADAVDSGLVTIAGPLTLLTEFAELFQIEGSQPEPS